MHWTITGVKPAAYYLKLFRSMWCPKISFSRILCMWQDLYPMCQEQNNLCNCLISDFCHVILHYFTLFYIILKRKLQHVDCKWVICGSHLDCSMVHWVNRCDPLSTLICAIATPYMFYANILLTTTYTWYNCSLYSYLLILH